MELRKELGSNIEIAVLDKVNERDAEARIAFYRSWYHDNSIFIRSGGKLVTLDKVRAMAQNGKVIIYLLYEPRTRIGIVGCTTQGLRHYRSKLMHQARKRNSSEADIWLNRCADNHITPGIRRLAKVPVAKAKEAQRREALERTNDGMTLLDVRTRNRKSDTPANDTIEDTTTVHLPDPLSPPYRLEDVPAGLRFDTYKGHNRHVRYKVRPESRIGLKVRNGSWSVLDKVKSSLSVRPYESLIQLGSVYAEDTGQGGLPYGYGYWQKYKDKRSGVYTLESTKAVYFELYKGAPPIYDPLSYEATPDDVAAMWSDFLSLPREEFSRLYPISVVWTANDDKQRALYAAAMGSSLRQGATLAA